MSVFRLYLYSDFTDIRWPHFSPIFSPIFLSDSRSGRGKDKHTNNVYSYGNIYQKYFEIIVLSHFKSKPIQCTLQLSWEVLQPQSNFVSPFLLYRRLLLSHCHCTDGTDGSSSNSHKKFAIDQVPTFSTLFCSMARGLTATNGDALQKKLCCVL